MGTVTTIYEDEEIKVLWHKGSSGVLLITFGGLLSLANGDSFFADAPVKKLGLSCVGFMAKKTNWYPEANMLNAIAAIAPVISRYPARITYGGSMGGYAAIKFSKALDASAALSLCPQWSLDKSECDDINPGYQNFFTPIMRGMSIKERDISGRVYLFYDPSHSEDSFHARKIQGLSPLINSIRFYSSDHQIAPILAGTENLQLILGHVKSGKLDELKSLTNSIRRKHKTRKRILLQKLSKRHPLLLSRVIDRGMGDLEHGITLDLNLSIIDKLSDDEKIPERLNALDRILSLDICDGRRQIFSRYKKEISAKLLNASYRSLKTSHKTTLTYNSLTGRIEHHNTNFIAKNGLIRPVKEIPAQGKSSAGVIVNGSSLYLLLHSNGETELVNRRSAEINRDRLVTLSTENGNLHIRSNGRYITAMPDGSISNDRTEAKGWETFQAIT